MINSEDISVVIQGAVDKTFTKLSIQSIRQQLPKSTIILSVWQGCNTDGLDFDRLLQSKDPGASICDYKYNIPNNLNRQIVSTQSGLNLVETKYALKLRSDMILVNKNFLNYYGKYSEFRSSNCKLFEERIIINNLYCANPEKTKFLFHISDWTQFGLTSDMLKLWKIPLQSDEEATYFLNKPRPKNSVHSSWVFKYIPEQYIWKTSLEENGVETNFKNFSDINPPNMQLSRLSIANNFMVVNYEDFGIKFLKFNPYKWSKHSQMNFSIWLKDFKEFCNPEFQTPFKHRIIQQVSSKKFDKYKKKLKRNFKRFAAPLTATLKWAISPISIILSIFRLILIIIKGIF